jgi:hypothetical protein
VIQIIFSEPQLIHICSGMALKGATLQTVSDTRRMISEEDDMKMHARTLARALFVTGVIALATTPAYAKLPVLYVWYYNYDNSPTWCKNLAWETLQNTDKNWHFTRKKYGTNSNWFQLKETRGHVNCSSRAGDKSLVTIVVTGSDNQEASDVFEEIKLGVCGKCSKLRN